MAQTKHEIQSLLTSAGMFPRHRFGQNFMIDQNLVRLVADAGTIHPGELVIEVGPGTGTLTEELLSRGARVLAVEIDRDLAAMLRTKFAGNSAFALIEGDALAGKHGLNAQLADAIGLARREGRAAKLVANLPYNIASPLIIELLLAGVDLLAFTVQKEVAERIRSPHGRDSYGLLSIMVQLLARVEVLRTLPPQAFWPEPAIESALVRLTREDRLGERAAAVSEFAQKLFSTRRKTLRKGLSMAGYDPGALERAKIDGGLRPQDIEPMQFVRLYEECARNGGNGA